LKGFDPWRPLAGLPGVRSMFIFNAPGRLHPYLDPDVLRPPRALRGL